MRQISFVLSCVFPSALAGLGLVNASALARTLHFIARPPGIPVLEFPGIADPQNSRREYPGISEILAGITGNFASFVFFSNFIVDYDILVFNLTAL